MSAVEQPAFLRTLRTIERDDRWFTPCPDVHASSGFSVLIRPDEKAGRYRLECVEAVNGDLCGRERDLLRMLGLTDADVALTGAALPLNFVPIEEFAGVDEPGAEPLVSDLENTGAAVPAGGLVVVYGDGGAGKTTLLADLMMHLGAGIDWCGVLSPARPLRVAWIENEGPRPMMRQKFDRKLEAWHGPSLDGRISVQDEPWARFTFRDENQRNELAAWLDKLETDILVVGPLSRIGMEGGGTSDDIRAFLELVESARAACERPPAIFIVHHENRAGQVSGTWEREPDSLIHIQGQGHGRTRVFWQKIRWCSALHATSTNLLWAEGESFTVEDKPEITDDTIAADIIAALIDLPGGSWSKIRERVTGNVSEAARVRDRLLASGRILNTSKRDGYFNLWNADDPATRSEPGTTLERLPDPALNGTANPSRSPVPDVSRNGERNGTAEQGAEPPEPDDEPDDLEPTPDHNEDPADAPSADDLEHVLPNSNGHYDADEIERLAWIATHIDEGAA